MGGKGGTAHLGGVYGCGTPGAVEARGTADSEVGEGSADADDRVDEYGNGLVESMVTRRLTWMGADRGPADTSTMAHLADTRLKPCGQPGSCG